MKITEVRKLSTKELTKESSKLRDEINTLRKGVYMGEVQNIKLIRHKRKDLARVLTVLGEQLRAEVA